MLEHRIAEYNNIETMYIELDQIYNVFMVLYYILANFNIGWLS